MLTFNRDSSRPPEMKDGVRNFKMTSKVAIDPVTKNITFYTTLRDLPRDISLAPNPRESPLWDAIQDTLLNKPGMFASLHNGLVLVAKSGTINEAKGEVSVVFRHYDGCLDGGRGYRNIQAVLQYLERMLKTLQGNPNSSPDEIAEIQAQLDTVYAQTWKIEILTNRSELEIRQISNARNTSKKVDEISRLNAAGVFDALKACLPEEIGDRIEWYQNQNGEGGDRHDIKASLLVKLVVMAAHSQEPKFAPWRFYASNEAGAKDFGKNYKTKEFQETFPHAERLLRIYDGIHALVAKHLRVDGKRLHSSLAAQETPRLFGKPLQFRIDDGYVYPIFAAILQACYRGGRWGVDPDRFMREYGSTVSDSMLDHLKKSHDRNPSSYGKLEDAYKAPSAAALGILARMAA